MRVTWPTTESSIITRLRIYPTTWHYSTNKRPRASSLRVNIKAPVCYAKWVVSLGVCVCVGFLRTNWPENHDAIFVQIWVGPSLVDTGNPLGALSACVCCTVMSVSSSLSIFVFVGAVECEIGWNINELIESDGPLECNALLMTECMLSCGRA